MARRASDGFIALQVVGWLAAVAVATWWVSGLLIYDYSGGGEALEIGISPVVYTPFGFIGLAVAVNLGRHLFAAVKTSDLSPSWRWVFLVLAGSFAYVGLFTAFVTTPVAEPDASVHIAIVPFLFAFPYYVLMLMLLIAGLWRVLLERREVRLGLR